MTQHAFGAKIDTHEELMVVGNGAKAGSAPEVSTYFLDAGKWSLLWFTMMTTRRNYFVQTRCNVSTKMTRMKIIIVV